MWIALGAVAAWRAGARLPVVREGAVFDAMKRAPSPSGPALRDAIAATKDYPGVTGIITIDQNHDALKPAVVLEVKGGKSVYATTIAP